MDFVSIFKEYQSTKLTQNLKNWYLEMRSIQTGLNMTILFGGLFILMIYLANISDVSYMISTISIIFAVMFALALFLNIFVRRQINKKYPKEAIKYKVYTHLYQGSLYELFDKNCTYTIETLKNKKIDLEQETSTYNGIFGYTLCNIQDEIDLALDKAKKDNENIILKELTELSD